MGPWQDAAFPGGQGKAGHAVACPNRPLLASRAMEVQGHGPWVANLDAGMPCLSNLGLHHQALGLEPDARCSLHSATGVGGASASLNLHADALAPMPKLQHRLMQETLSMGYHPFEHLTKNPKLCSQGANPVLA